MKSNRPQPDSKCRLRTTDREVRTALLMKARAAHARSPDTLIIEELGLEHGICRVDVAVVNGRLHGYEIKSDADTLERLPAQALVYSRVLDRVTLVVGERHVNEAEKLVPRWWGIQLVSPANTGILRICAARPARPNPNVSAFHLAHLLWRSELLEALSRYAPQLAHVKSNRIDLCKTLAELAPLSALKSEVRERLKRRTAWRCHALPSSHDG
jgi:hypothetical protein